MYPVVVNKYINAEKCQNHILVSKYSQATDTTQSANLTGHVFFYPSSHYHSTQPQEGYENIPET